jgi:hypothetical protein
MVLYLGLTRNEQNEDPRILTQSSDTVDNLLSAVGMGLLHWIVVHDTATRSSTKHVSGAAIAGRSYLKYKK